MMVHADAERRKRAAAERGLREEAREAYGGAGSGEGQGAFGGEGYHAMGDFAGSSRDPEPELSEAQRRDVEEERATRPDLGWQNRPPAPSAGTGS